MNERERLLAVRVVRWRFAGHDKHQLAPTTGDLGGLSLATDESNDNEHGHDGTPHLAPPHGRRQHGRTPAFVTAFGVPEETADRPARRRTLASEARGPTVG